MGLISQLKAPAMPAKSARFASSFYFFHTNLFRRIANNSKNRAFLNILTASNVPKGICEPGIIHTKKVGSMLKSDYW
jgi:hypothetical protein